MIEEYKRDVLVLAHNYQIPRIQDAADYVGDSLGLCQEAQKAEKPYILFCGVDFMAESAAMLNPDKTVIVPTYKARCPMAAMLPAEELRRAKAEHPKAATVLYINSRLEARAESDVTCTSANAAKIVKALDEDEILFGPDKNLAWYVARQAPEKKIIPVPLHGHCRVHVRFKPEHIQRAREQHPDAEVLAHPECPPDVQLLADHVCSTEQMVKRARSSPAKKFVIATEVGLLHRLKKEAPQKIFVPALNTADCINQKRNTWENFVIALSGRKNVVRVDEKLAARAKASLERMLELSK